MSEFVHPLTRWRRLTSTPVTTESRVAVWDEDRDVDGWADVRWVAGHARLGPVRDEAGEIIDPNPEFVS